MAGMCCGVVGETETVPLPLESTARTSRHRGPEIRPLKFVADEVKCSPAENIRKRRKLDSLRGCENAKQRLSDGVEGSVTGEALCKNQGVVGGSPKFGMTSVCGRRRDMEDTVAIRPSFLPPRPDSPLGSQFYGVYDGHGCSHVAAKCKDRLHEIVKEEFESFDEVAAPEASWRGAMERSFSRMDKEVKEWCSGATKSDCRCELQTPQCDAVGSTAVIAVVTPEKVVVSNCGDSRAVLCRSGVAIPLSSDHKPDRPDELERIQAAGGRVIYWDGPRVLGVLAMSRAIGDDYLKPYVIAEPEVTVTDRTAADECLILASDGLWDVVDNDTACGVAGMCLRGHRTASPPPRDSAASSDKACSDAAILLTKLALARNSTDNVSVVVVDLRMML